ncbi:hypothetical protein SO802_008809, partial [Lithocarpus litseifolius]
MLEELNFPPLPSAGGGYIDENSYVLGSYEFFLEFSQDNQVMQNQLRQRTSLGTKFGPYSKTAIVQQVKNSV